MAKGELEPQEFQMGDALLDAARGALRIFGGMVQVAAAMTRGMAVAVLKAAIAAEKAVETLEMDEQKSDSESKPMPKPKPKPRRSRPAERES